MKKILCYGDSLTWGKIPQGDRYDENTRFTKVMQKELGERYLVIGEGLRSRMAKGENPYAEGKDGLKQFRSIFLNIYQ